MLLDAGVPFTMQEPTWSPERVLNPNPGSPVFAPPVLVKGDFVLSQTPAILHFLGGAHGYYASEATAEESAICLQTLLDIGDVTSELFNIAKDVEKKADFSKPGGRLAGWLAHFDKTLGGKSFLRGDKPSPSDFFLLSSFESFEFALGVEIVSTICPEGLVPWRQAMENRPFFATYSSQSKPILFPSMKSA
jgi:glutathione S-transferase